MTDDDNLRAYIEPVYRDIPPVHGEHVYDLVTPEATTVDIPITFTEVRRDIIDAMIAIDEGYMHAPGDDEALPAGVRAIVERTAADDNRSAGEYWVKYRPAPDPFADGDGYEVMLTPARIVRGPLTVDVTVDTDALTAGLERVREHFVKLGEVVGPALADVFDKMRAAWAPLSESLTGRGIVYLTDGAGPGPATGPESALAWLAYAETVMILQHPPKALRKRAKARYLEVKRHLAAEHRRRLRKVAVNQFGAL